MKAILKQFSGRNHGPAVQFVKYAISGGIATAVHILIFYLMACLVFPALSHEDVLVRLLHLPVADLRDAVRARNSDMNNAVAFLFSNLTAYLLSIAWVFESGRHHRVVEIGFFYLVSGFSMLVGTTLMDLLIRHGGLTTTAAFGVNIVTSLAINFVMRKYAIFKG